MSERTRWIVTEVALKGVPLTLLFAGLVWFFWLPQHEVVRAGTYLNGVLVGWYLPSTIADIIRDRPINLFFKLMNYVVALLYLSAAGFSIWAGNAPQLAVGALVTFAIWSGMSVLHRSPMIVRHEANRARFSPSTIKATV